MAKADFYPRISLNGSTGFQSLQLSNLADWASGQFVVGPSITLPIFKGGRLKGTLHLREAQQQEAPIVYKRTSCSTRRASLSKARPTPPPI
jgi:outer membrane protein TolC